MGKVVLNLILISLFHFSGLSQYYKTKKSIKKHFDFCFDNNCNFSNNSFIKNGYFKSIKDETTNLVFDEMILFSNGLAVSYFNVDQHYSSSVKYIDTLASQQGFNQHLWDFKRYAYWGVYEINDDILTIKLLRKPKCCGNMEHAQRIHCAKFKILNNTTIQKIEEWIIRPNMKLEVWEMEVEKIELKFEPVTKLPPAEGWPLYEEWFWCDKEEYAKWKVKKGLDPKLNRMPRYKQIVKDQINK